MIRIGGRVKGVLFVAASVVLSACAQLFMKAGMLDMHGHDIISLWQSGSLQLQLVLPSILWVFAGLGCYAVSMLFWMAALTRYELSLAYPMLSLSYVLVYLAAAYWPRLEESMNPVKSLGIFLIMLGVVLVTRSARKAT